MKKRSLLMLLVLIGILPTCSAQNVSPGYRVFHEVDTVWHFGYKGINLASRKMHRIDIAYQSKNVDGSDIELSGYVCIPHDIYTGEQPCDGILLYNHYTQTSHDMAPTRGYAIGEDMVMANPLKPNYIVVNSDFIGFGVSEDKLQTFCFSDINGQASIDCFLAARKLLDDRHIPQGKFVINAGYSSGGFDAIATQRVRDMKYKDQINFHKTLCGGMPFDIMASYKKFIDWKNDSTVDATCLPLMLGFYNHHAKLGYTYDQMFKEPLASKYEEWFLSGRHSMSEVMDSLKGVKLTTIVQEPFLDTSSEVFKHLESVAKEYSLAKDWIPDSTQRYFVMHLIRDNVVPVEGGRAFINFLSNTNYDGQKCAGFKKTIVPERTHLQTNFFIPSARHTLVGGIIFYLNLAATLTATPILYYDDELNTHYADFVESATVMGIIRLLESKGINVREVVKQLTSSGNSSASSDIFSFLAQMEKTLNNMGTNTAEVLTILQDSGVEFTDILEIYTYLTTEPTTVNPDVSMPKHAPTILEPCLISYYQQQLIDWLHSNNVQLDEE